MDEVDANDFEAVCLFESDMDAFCEQHGHEPAVSVEWLTWRRDRRREKIELMRSVMQRWGFFFQLIGVAHAKAVRRR